MFEFVRRNFKSNRVASGTPVYTKLVGQRSPAVGASKMVGAQPFLADQ